MIKDNLFQKFYFEWWRNIDKTILFLILLLFILGLFFSLVSTSLVASDRLNTNNYLFFFKHLVFISLGLGILFFLSYLNAEKLFILSKFLFLICLISLVLVPFIGVEVKGSKRWLDFLFLPRFQPIELLKPFLIVMIASILSSKNKTNLYLKYFLSFLLILPIIILLISQPDVGQTILIFFTWLALIFVSGINLFLFFTFFGFMISIILYLIFFVSKFEYILIRINSFFDPSSGNNYQSEKASEAIINGGFFGKGIGEGVLKNKVPEAHTDYIVSVISEEFGVVMIFLLLVIFLFFIYHIFKKLFFINDNKVKLIIIGSSVIILFQFLIHIGVNIRMFPTTGMTLPFLSYGGSSIVSTSILCGIILNLTKKNFLR
ncbi:MAG: FtsW/RodA/SpoVE family cell cycle protein [Candidatus Pelagibacter sp.]